MKKTTNSEVIFRGRKKPTSEDMMAIAKETLELYVPLARRLGLHDAADELTERSFGIVRDLLGDPEDDSEQGHEKGKEQKNKKPD